MPKFMKKFIEDGAVTPSSLEEKGPMHYQLWFYNAPYSITLAHYPNAEGDGRVEFSFRKDKYFDMKPKDHVYMDLQRGVSKIDSFERQIYSDVQIPFDKKPFILWNKFVRFAKIDSLFRLARENYKAHPHHYEERTDAKAEDDNYAATVVCIQKKIWFEIFDKIKFVHCPCFEFDEDKLFDSQTFDQAVDQIFETVENVGRCKEMSEDARIELKMPFFK